MNDLTPLKIGIAFEGENRDFTVIEKLIQKILPVELNYTISIRISARTSILGYVPAYTRRFFLQNDPVHVGIFITDQDQDQNDRVKSIKESITKVNSGYLDFLVIGVPDPHLEKWLIADQNAVKRVFKLRGDQELPGNHLVPKEQIQYIRGGVINEQPSFFEACEKLANELEIDVVKERCSDFKLFAEELTRVVKNL